MDARRRKRGIQGTDFAEHGYPLLTPRLTALIIVAYRLSPAKTLQDNEPRRFFEDSEGIMWEVREVKVDYDRRASGSLIFESIGAVRRVRNYPANWHELSVAELNEISHRA
jgi:hypothetical protein